MHFDTMYDSKVIKIFLFYKLPDGKTYEVTSCYHLWQSISIPTNEKVRCYEA